MSENPHDLASDVICTEADNWEDYREYLDSEDCAQMLREERRNNLRRSDNIATIEAITGYRYNGMTERFEECK